MLKVPADIVRMRADNSLVMSKDSHELIKKNKNMLKNAQIRAKALIRDAVNESDGIKREAYCLGYERGLKMAIDSFCQYIDGNDGHIRNAYAGIFQKLEKMLTDVLDDEEIVRRILERWIDDVEPVASKIDVLIPRTHKKFKRVLSQAADNGCIEKCIFEYHDEPYFIFKYRDAIAEFFPNELINETMSSITDNMSLHIKMRASAEEAMAQFLSELSRQYSNVSDDNDN